MSISHKRLNFLQKLKHVTLACTQQKSYGHTTFTIWFICLSIVSMDGIFGLKLTSVPKNGSKCQIFASLTCKVIILHHMKPILMQNEISRNGFVWFIGFALDDLLIVNNVNFNIIMNFKITKYEISAHRERI